MAVDERAGIVGFQSLDLWSPLLPSMAALRRFEDLAALEDVTLRFGDGHRLPLLVRLGDPPEPCLIEADPAVVLAGRPARARFALTYAKKSVICKYPPSQRVCDEQLQ